MLKTGDFMFVSVVMQEDKWLQLVGLHHMSVRHLEYARFDIFPADGQGVEYKGTSLISRENNAAVRVMYDADEVRSRGSQDRRPATPGSR